MHDRQRHVADARDAPPIDLAHLTHQTLGDPQLRREVLELFLDQAASVRAEIAVADAKERRNIAHRLVGSARAVGAFSLADCAAELELSPHSASTAERLSSLVDDVTSFASAFMR